MHGLNLELNPVEIAKELTIAWLANPNTRTSSEDVPAFLNKVYKTVLVLVQCSATAAASEAPPEEHVPAVTARKSLSSPNHIISMIDGRPYKTLRRHVAANGMTPAEYRERYGLKEDYPMVAPAYSEARRAMAKDRGLGRKPGETNAAMAGAKRTRAPLKHQDDEAAAE